MAKKRTSVLEERSSELAPAFSGTSVSGVQVIDEPVPGSRYRHVTVVWDKWEGISQPDRGKVILDAFEKAHPKEPWRALEITLAMGLTAAEANKLKIKVA